MKPSEVKSSEGFFVLNIVGVRVTKCIEKTDSGFLDTSFASLRITRKPSVIGLRVAKRIEKTDSGFLDTNLTSFGFTRKPLVIGLRVAKRIEKTDIELWFFDFSIYDFKNINSNAETQSS